MKNLLFFVIFLALAYVSLGKNLERFEPPLPPEGDPDMPDLPNFPPHEENPDMPDIPTDLTMPTTTPNIITSPTTATTTTTTSVLEVRFKNELVRVLVHLTKKRTFRSLLVL